MATRRKSPSTNVVSVVGKRPRPARRVCREQRVPVAEAAEEPRGTLGVGQAHGANAVVVAPMSGGVPPAGARRRGAAHVRRVEPACARLKALSETAATPDASEPPHLCDGFVRDDVGAVSPVERRRDVTGHLETPDRRGAGCREMIGKLFRERTFSIGIKCNRIQSSLSNFRVCDRPGATDFCPLFNRFLTRLYILELPQNGRDSAFLRRDGECLS